MKKYHEFIKVSNALDCKLKIEGTLVKYFCWKLLHTSNKSTIHLFSNTDKKKKKKIQYVWKVNKITITKNIGLDSQKTSQLN